jgi:hypothetical protein
MTAPGVRTGNLTYWTLVTTDKKKKSLYCITHKVFHIFTSCCLVTASNSGYSSINNKLLIYKVILTPIWTYGIKFWGTIYNSNIEILERFQSKILRLIVAAPWYVSNSVIRKDLQIPTVKEEISRFNSHYNVRNSVHPNEIIASLTE